MYGKMKVGGGPGPYLQQFYPFILLPPRPELLEVEVLYFTVVYPVQKYRSTVVLPGIPYRDEIVGV